VEHLPAINKSKSGWLTVVACGIVLIMWYQPVSGGSEYEENVVSTISDITNSKIEPSLDALNQLVETHPNSKIGQLLLADLLAARAGKAKMIDQFQQENGQLQGLKDEILYRWKNHTGYRSADAGMVPANLVQLSPRQQHAIVVDASQARLFVYRNLGHETVLVADYYMTVGKEGMGKTRQGDLRTPVGVYHVTTYLSGETLPPRYGPGAYPINYPNEIDKLKNRTGYGIWIHGTEPENHNRIPRASDGCVSLSNDEFHDIEKYIKTDGSTAVIIGEEFNWTSTTALQKQRAMLGDVLNQWKEDLENTDNSKFLNHYAFKGVHNQKTGIKSWTDHHKHLRQVAASLVINIRNLSILSYPGDHEIVVMSFDQEYLSDSYHSSAPKTLYWQKQADNFWRIIHES
jgi:murein L,D-transpeptidase YafK